MHLVPLVLCTFQPHEDGPVGPGCRFISSRHTHNTCSRCYLRPPDRWRPARHRSVWPWIVWGSAPFCADPRRTAGSRGSPPHRYRQRLTRRAGKHEHVTPGEGKTGRRSIAECRYISFKSHFKAFYFLLSCCSRTEFWFIHAKMNKWRIFIFQINNPEDKRLCTGVQHPLFHYIQGWVSCSRTHRLGRGLNRQPPDCRTDLLTTHPQAYSFSLYFFTYSHTTS